VSEPVYPADRGDMGAASPARARPAPLKALFAAATAPYRRADRFAYLFAHGKLKRDPVFRAILERGLLAGHHHILDLGCGQGLLAAWLQAASRCHGRGEWPAAWPAPPPVQSIRGVELMAQDVARARLALGSAFDIVHGDLRTTDFGQVDAVVVLDVLHYVGPDAQLAALRRIRAALPVGGLLLLRVGDARGGLRFKLSQWADSLIMRGRGHGRVRTYCRPLAEWRQVLTQCGFDSEPAWMSAGTPFANVLLIAHAR
jgi:SAM-dependent methyltransferase